MTAFNRSLVLCDVENLSAVPPPIGTRSDYQCGLRLLSELVEVRPVDHVVVASHPNERGVFAARSVFPGCLVKVGHGPDGADRLLLEHLQDSDWVADRFALVVIGSGDGVFADSVAALATRGIPTVVVSRRDRCSRRLSACAAEVVFLPEPVDVPDTLRRGPQSSRLAEDHGRYRALDGNRRAA